MNLAENLARSAAERGDHVALKLDDVELTYKQLDCAAARIANLLADKGVEAGDRVGIMLPNVPYFAACYYGVLRMGGVVVPMNVLLKKREVGFYLSDPEAKLLFAWYDFAEAAEAGAAEAGAELILVKPGEFEQLVDQYSDEAEVVDRDGDDTAVILYTSGTTGTPKGAELTHSNLGRNVELAVEAVRPPRRPGDSRRAAAVSLLRPDLRPQHLHRRRRHPDPDPALRPRQGPGDHGTRQRRRVPGRADDVRGDAQPPRAPRTSTPPRSRSAPRAARRCRSR